MIGAPFLSLDLNYLNALANRPVSTWSVREIDAVLAYAREAVLARTEPSES